MKITYTFTRFLKLTVSFFMAAAGLVLLQACGGGGSTSTPVPLDPIERVSIDPIGDEADNSSYGGSISGDGRYVVFDSSASNLVVNDTNFSDDVFLHDTQTDLITRISVSSDGTQADSISYNGIVSADGRYVTFLSYATNLVVDDTNAVTDVFLHDTQTGVTSRVSVDSNGLQADDASSFPAISSNGRYVAFLSDATNLVSNDINSNRDVFVHDTESGTTRRVNVDSSGTEANNASDSVSISPDGRYIAFDSTASNLVSGDANTVADIFVHDMQNSVTARVSLASTGQEGNGASYLPSISSNGRFVAFSTSASNMVANDTNANDDVYIRDTQTSTTTRASLSSLGAEPNGFSDFAVISSDGRYVVFISNSSNLVSGDTNGFKDLFVRDTQNSTTARVNVAANGAEAIGDSLEGGFAISADGRYVVFDSAASNLVNDDTNSFYDVFRAPNKAR